MFILSLSSSVMHGNYKYAIVNPISVPSNSFNECKCLKTLKSFCEYSISKSTPLSCIWKKIHYKSYVKKTVTENL